MTTRDASKPAATAATNASAEAEGGWAGKAVWFVLALVVLAADLISKDMVFEPLEPGRIDYVFGSWFGFTKVWNSGMMWGMFPEHPEILVWGRVLAALAVIWMIVSTPRISRMLLLALALVLGGAIGNIYDGFAFGQVRDFLMVDLDTPGFDPFPIFNVADSAISAGVTLLALGMLLEALRAKRKPGIEDAPASPS